MDSDTISDRTLNNRHNCPTDDRHVHQAGAISRQRPELGDAESEDTREHDGVEKTDCNHAPHCEVTTGKHGKCNEHRRTKRAHGKKASRLKPLQNTSANEAPDHSATPV